MPAANNYMEILRESALAENEQNLLLCSNLNHLESKKLKLICKNRNKKHIKTGYISLKRK
jgi:hypothetical protein